MTGRALAITAASPLTLAVLPVPVRPLLSSGHHVAAATPIASASAPPVVGTVAQRAARVGLSCPTNRESVPRAISRPADCGAMHVGRTQTSCPTPTRCTVDLIGNLHA